MNWLRAKASQKRTPSIKRNYLFNLFYELVALLTPLITVPHVSRALTDVGVGQYSFTTSIISYFSTFAGLGFTYYAQRLIAKHQGNKQNQSIDFWEVFFARLIPISISLIVFFLLVFCNVYATKYQNLMYLGGLTLFASVFDVYFLYKGNEEFGIISVQSTIVRIFSIIAIFIFVNNENDVLLYALIMDLTPLFANLILWIGVKKRINKVPIRALHPTRHLFPSFVLFLPTIASTVFTTLDKTLIGVITGSDSENGNYEYAQKFTEMVSTVVTSLGVVIMPRNASESAKGDMASVKENVYKTMRFGWFLGVPLTFGTMAIVNNFVPWYLGSGFEKTAALTAILSPVILTNAFIAVLGVQYLMAIGRDKEYTLSIFVGAVSDAVLDWLFITFLSGYGAAIATVIANCIVLFLMLRCVKNEFSIRLFFTMSWKYIIAGLIMFIPCYFMSCYFLPNIGNTFIIIFSGVLLYSLALFFEKDPLLLTVLLKAESKIGKMIRCQRQGSKRKGAKP